MEYNVKTNKVETSIDTVIKALKNKQVATDSIIQLAAEGKSEYNYSKLYGEKECLSFELEMWKKGVKLFSTLLSKDAKGMFKEYAWRE